MFYILDTILINDKTDMTQLSSTLEDVLLAGVMGRVEVAPRLMALLLSKVKDTVKRLHPLVPAQFYLPAPPLYCPQPSASDEVNIISYHPLVPAQFYLPAPPLYCPQPSSSDQVNIRSYLPLK